jgi:hypothetical protein
VLVAVSIANTAITVIDTMITVHRAGEKVEVKACNHHRSETALPPAQWHDISSKYRWTDVFVKRNGRWQMVAEQGTRVSQQ